MDPREELGGLLKKGAGSGKVLVVSDGAIDLAASGRLRIYLLEILMDEASAPAGGRGGGLGERRVARILRFSRDDKGEWRKDIELAGEALKGLEAPYHASLLPITLPEGEELVVYGLMEEGLVEDYDERLGLSGRG